MRHSRDEASTEHEIARTLRAELISWAEQEFTRGLRHAETHCWSCGKEHEEGLTHCPYCGEDLVPF
jgi:zinc-ribbon domain